METKKYNLMDLPYGYADLSPNMSEEQLRIHHTKHHKAYVDNSNTLLEALEKARGGNLDADFGTVAKQLSFSSGGMLLHNFFWKNLGKPKQDNKPTGKIADLINSEFGSFDRFKKEFTQTAMKTEGSGWAILTFCLTLQRPIIMQVEKHNVNVVPRRPLLLVIDVWEHAYYIDYKNDRAKYIESFWNLINWDEVNKRLEDLL
jgi:superoxide dismutase, Fe-Mn family